ncbi:RNase H domain-containing protein [Trichonephila clavipes]|nr:RNase H domain-containing protein [Trichonephila clavipes]
MQDGATSHTANPVKAFLIQTFGKDRIVSRRCRYPWPPRSPDLTPVDFWLWGYLKSRVYLSGPLSLLELKDAIRREVSSIQPDMLHFRCWICHSSGMSSPLWWWLCRTYSGVSHGCLFPLEKFHSNASIPPEHASYLDTPTTVPCKVRVEQDGFITSWSSRRIRRLMSVQNNLSYDSCNLITRFHSSNIQCLLPRHHCKRFFAFRAETRERNAINIVQFSDKSTDIFPVICYTDSSKIDGRVGFAFVVFRSGVESENFQFRIRDECTVFEAELLCLNFTVKWIIEQNSVISECLICTDSLSSLDSLKCFSSSNNIIVEIQKQLKSLRYKNISIDFGFVRGHTGVLGNERADWLAKAATKRKIDIDVNIPESFYKEITKERMVKSWNQEYLIA